MSRLFCCALVILVVASTLQACSICSGSLLNRQTLREELRHSQAAIAGTLKNPKPDPEGLGGTTEFHFDNTLKAHKVFGDAKAIVVPKYYPIIGSTPPDYLFFFDISNHKWAISNGVPSSKTLTAYLAEAAKLDENTAGKQLGFFFQHLESTEDTVAADAFLEFARAADADIASAKATFDAKRLRTWLTAKETKDERLGVYAVLLGLCGEATDRELLRGLLKQPRAAGNLSGVLAALVALDAKTGWQDIATMLTDDKRTFEQRYAAMQAVRFLQATHGKQHRAMILAVFAALLKDMDFADLVIDDLRRWGWWDITEDVLAIYPQAKARLLKSTLLRYALCCPEPAASAFLAALRKAEPQTVKQAEEKLKLLEK